MSNSYKPVTFLNSKGEVISNDPVYLAQQTLAAANISMGSNSGDDRDDSEDLLDETPDYTHLKGKDLGQYARERGVDIKGLKAGEVRQALMDLDAEEATDSSEDETEDDEAEDEDETQE